jgi:hypothetical protein
MPDRRRPRWLPFLLAFVVLTALLFGPPLVRGMVAERPPPATGPTATTGPGRPAVIPPGDD